MPYVRWKTHKFPTKKGPKINVKALFVEALAPPFTFHHLLEFASNVSIRRMIDEKSVTGKNLLIDLIGKKKIVDHDKQISIIRISNTTKIFPPYPFSYFDFKKMIYAKTYLWKEIRG
ncbi:hypothetical protein M3589_21245 [Heyndrickxia oleronia]|uniref:hypothetical protein n=1 Tax=Heyndrickxia oleronia TaxID=38875 RepID=UPI00203C9EDB|nr:hypothetical protein [Heyndrickxia oleronia]MCM3240207.1 hypothetical protein [Heyndrickxia oleronia]